MVAGVVILAWGVTFVNTRALLQDFSALEIQLLRFGIAWGVLKAASLWRGRSAAVLLPIARCGVIWYHLCVRR